jgi:hypothetical protein
MQLIGLDELALILMALPEHLVEQATAIVGRAADRMMAETAAGYPSGGTGNLRKGLTKTEEAVGRFGVAYQVKNKAPHAWWFEHGTQTRHTASGAKRGVMFGKQEGLTGPRTPPGHVFIPTAARVRAAMYRELREMLVAEGLILSDAP